MSFAKAYLDDITFSFRKQKQLVEKALAQVSDATLEALKNMGHRMEPWRGRQGIVEAIQRTAGGWIGVSDPRAAGRALGY